jgi:CheY-like chemotaxis protein
MKKVLIVEDEIILSMAIQRSLENAGFEIMTSVFSAEEALDIIDEKTPDLIIMDVTLQGDMDGLEATRLIKEKKDIPIIVTTAHSDSNMVEKIESSGCDDLLFKPVNYNEMITRINKILL